MPHGQFTNVTLSGGNKIHIQGKTFAHKHAEHSTPTAILITLVALANPDKRSTCRPNALIGEWDAFVSADTSEGRFAAHEAVIVIGAAAHEDPDLDNPFVWLGFYEIGEPGRRHTAVTLVVQH
jgi:hypothetical protein